MSREEMNHPVGAGSRVKAGLREDILGPAARPQRRAQYMTAKQRNMFGLMFGSLYSGAGHSHHEKTLREQPEHSPSSPGSAHHQWRYQTGLMASVHPGAPHPERGLSVSPFDPVLP